MNISFAESILYDLRNMKTIILTIFCALALTEGVSKINKIKNYGIH